MAEPLPSPELETASPDLLALKARNGCLRSFEELVDVTKDRLYGYLLKMLGNPHDAEDVAQETYLKAYRHLASYNPNHRFAAWLYTIARNTAISFRRKHRRTESIDELAEVLPAKSMSHSASDGDAIWAVARQLKPKYFEVLWLRYGEDFDTPEIAQAMQTNLIYVKVLLHRARNELAKRLQKKGMI